MQFSDLPATKPITASWRPKDLADAIAAVIGSEGRLLSYDIVRDGPSSCRIYYADPAEQAGRVSLPDYSRTPAGLAADLRRFSGEARYQMPKPPNTFKGWEIRMAEINGEQALVAMAAWVEAA